MLLQIILALAIGVLSGTLTGLFPGIHINLIAAGLLALVTGGVFMNFEPIVLVVFVVAMAVTHTFLDFIPAVFLGAPEEDSFLAVLPGHQMLKEGRGHEAVIYTLYGSLVALPIILIFSFSFIYFLGDVYSYIHVAIPYVLIFASFYLIFRENYVWSAVAVFLLAGFLGLFAFNSPVREPLLPMLSGLFGVSGLIVSINSKVKIPMQKVPRLREAGFGVNSLKPIFAGAIVSSLSSFLPGVGAGHAAVLSSEIADIDEDKNNFLFLVGMINTVVMALSFVTVYVAGRTRTGAAVAVSKLLGEISFGNLFVVLLVVSVSGLIAFLVGVNLSKIFASRICSFDYTKISLMVLGILVIVNFVLTNWVGLVVLVTSSALGVFCIVSGVRRIQLMGALLLPTIVFYLFG